MTKTTMPEPVAWVRRHPDGALTAEFLEDAVISPVRKESGAWLPMVTTTQAEAYADARVREAQRWISVEDRLPEPETDVLVKCSSKFGHLGFDIAGIFRGEWLSQITERDCRWPVSHWMPLPAPPLPGPVEP